MTGVLVRGETRRQGHQGAGHVTTEAVVGTFTSQGALGSTWRHQKPEARKGPPLKPSEGARPADTLISDFWHQNCERINLGCSNTLTCHSSPQETDTWGQNAWGHQ